MILIDYKDRRPIYEQIISRFEDLILKGVFEPSSQIPSVRSLAIDLSINPNTIQKAYAELERKGLIYTVKGKGSFVTDNYVIFEEKKIEVLSKIKDITKEALNIGITKEEIINIVNVQEKEDAK